MDKLIKMRQIFECSLDDLVQGDVSRHGVPARDDLGGYSPVRVATEGAVGDMSAGPLTSHRGMHLLVNLRDLHAHVPPPVSVLFPPV